MPAPKLKHFFNEHNIHYKSCKHAPAYTSLELAHENHVPEHAWAKVVIVNIDGDLAMIVLPSDHKVDLEHFKSLIGAKHVSLSTEDEFSKQFPECEPGAMPIFGNLYNMAMYADESLKDNKKISFNGGSHSEFITISYEDFIHFANPKIVSFD